MQNTLVCLGCQQTKPANPHVHHQEYCGEHHCQCIRKRDWVKQKMKQDASFRQSQRDNQKDWYDNHPNYQKTYREKNPKYVTTNREQQKWRNAKRRRRPIVPERIVKIDAPDSTRTEGYGEKVIVKIDASTPIKMSFYLELETAEQIVKIDASMAQAPVFFKPKAPAGPALG